MRRAWLLLPVLMAVSIASGVLLSMQLTSAQTNTNTTLALDMDISGNAYDEATNTMTVGTVDFCSVGNSTDTLHTHVAHVIVRDVEDMIGWQVRVNYDGGQIRPFTVNFAPFTDNNTGQQISFVNLPIDSNSAVHRDLTSASQIPPQAAGAQTAAFGSSYLATQTAEVSPDTPPKASSDGGAYSAPSGGVLASLIVQVQAGQAANNALTLDVDDDSPNAPGSGISYFDGSQGVQVVLSEFALGDGVHAEGGQCAQATPPPVTPTPTDTGTPPPGATPSTTPTATSGLLGTGTPTPTGAAAGRTPTRTPGASPAALPPTGGSQGASGLTYVLLLAALAVPASGAAYGIWRLRRN
jgi:hypothetical protein